MTMNRFRPSRRNAALAMLLLFSACASAGRPDREPTRVDPYHEINRSLRGEQAIVELANGEVAQGVSHVHLSATETTWVDRSDTRRVPTDAVSRVIVVSHPRQRSPAAFVLLLGLGLSLAFDDVRPLDVALQVALEPFIWGTPVSPAVGYVVYSGADLAP
jgi:hypothetical protein